MEILSAMISFESLFGYYLFSLLIVAIGSFLAFRSLNRSVYLHHRIAVTGTSIGIIVVNLVLGVTIAHQLTKVPDIISITPQPASILDWNSPEITVSFATPIQFKSLRVYSYPENELEIIPHDYLYNRTGIGRSVTIKPKNNFPPGEPVIVYFANIEGPLTFGYGGEHDIHFLSPDLPTITSISTPSALTNVPVNQHITFTLSKAVSQFSNWHAEVTPPIPFTLAAKNNVLTLTPSVDYEEGATYSVQLSQIPKILRLTDKATVTELTPKLEKNVTFTTVRPPYVNAIDPHGDAVNPNDPITVQFAEPMDVLSVESNITASPSFQMNFSWNLAKTLLTMSHEPFPKQTSYTLTLTAGIKTEANGKSQSPAVHTFTTAGPVMLRSSDPENASDEVTPSAQIRLHFNQPIQNTSLTQTFSIYPFVQGSFTGNGQDIIWTPVQPFSSNRQYTVNLAPGIESIYGLPSHERFSFSFTTTSGSVVLNVPYYPQESLFTCNIAAARMLLSYRNIQVSEKDLISKIGSGGKRGTGNPYKGYVDDYGTYWDAVSKGVSSYRSNRLIINGTIADIVREIKNGNPVMTWGQNGWSDPHDISWTSTDGTFIKAVNGMHSAVVRGFTGPETNPVTVLINDPWRGQYAIPTNEFLRRWGFFNVAMVVD